MQRSSQFTIQSHKPCSWIARIVVAMLLVSCARDGGAENGNQSAFLVHDKRVQFEGEALNGNIEAAHRLIAHFYYADSDPYQEEIWLETAIRDGDKDASVSLGELLTEGCDGYPVNDQSCHRGYLLLIEAARDGSRSAKNILSALPYHCR